MASFSFATCCDDFVDPLNNEMQILKKCLNTHSQSQKIDSFRFPIKDTIVGKNIKFFNIYCTANDEEICRHGIM